MGSEGHEAAKKTMHHDLAAMGFISLVLKLGEPLEIICTCKNCSGGRAAQLARPKELDWLLIGNPQIHHIDPRTQGIHRPRVELPHVFVIQQNCKLWSLDLIENGEHNICLFGASFTMSRVRTRIKLHSYGTCAHIWSRKNNIFHWCNNSSMYPCVPACCAYGSMCISTPTVYAHACSP